MFFSSNILYTKLVNIIKFYDMEHAKDLTHFLFRIKT